MDISQERVILILRLSAISASVNVNRALPHNGYLGLFGTQATVRSVFRLTRMSEMFDIFSSRADALAKHQQT